MRRKFNSGAFTLVELLAVIGIMGLLAAVGVPALKGLTGSGGAKAGARAVNWCAGASKKHGNLDCDKCCGDFSHTNSNQRRICVSDYGGGHLGGD